MGEDHECVWHLIGWAIRVYGIMMVRAIRMYVLMRRRDMKMYGSIRGRKRRYGTMRGGPCEGGGCHDGIQNFQNKTLKLMQRGKRTSLVSQRQKTKLSISSTSQNLQPSYFSIESL